MVCMATIFGFAGCQTVRDTNSSTKISTQSSISNSKEQNFNDSSLVGSNDILESEKVNSSGLSIKESSCIKDSFTSQESFSSIQGNLSESSFSIF